MKKKSAKKTSAKKAAAKTAYSLHVALNSVDPKHYQGWDGALTACEFDANDMAAIAKKKKFKSITKLMTKQATAEAVRGAILDAAKKLSSGDLFFLTYSGHGGQVPDLNHDEDKVPRRLKDAKDETWCLYDRELVDDELYELWAKFKPGVRILVLSDSCHSGTVTKEGPPRPDANGNFRRVRKMPVSVAEATFKAHRKLYKKIQDENPSAEDANIKASVILISGCMDNQESADGDRNGLFTQNLRAVWKNGAFKGTYSAFRDRIVSQMPDEQTPNYFFVGRASRIFEAEAPFTV